MPYAEHLEEAVFPSAAKVVKAVKEVLYAGE
jgi:pyruvate/2-oxoglutarate/acetoin dehydrogenase E1 component